MYNLNVVVIHNTKKNSDDATNYPQTYENHYQNYKRFYHEDDMKGIA